MPLTTAQVAILKTELQNDPRALGYAPYVTIRDFTSLAQMLTWTRDGVTPCPTNAVVGPTGNITGATNATPIVVTSTAHGLVTGDSVVVTGVLGNVAANGTFKVTKVNNNSFSLDGSVGNGAYVSGGAWVWCVSGVRVPFVNVQDVFGSIDSSDLITNGLATAVTADQFGKLILFQTICGDARMQGQIALTDSSGNDNNNGKTLKKVVANPSTSRNAINALTVRLGSRLEQVLAVSGVTPTEADLIAALA